MAFCKKFLVDLCKIHYDRSLKLTLYNTGLNLYQNIQIIYRLQHHLHYIRVISLYPIKYFGNVWTLRTNFSFNYTVIQTTKHIIHITINFIHSNDKSIIKNKYMKIIKTKQSRNQISVSFLMLATIRVFFP